MTRHLLVSCAAAFVLGTLAGFLVLVAWVNGYWLPAEEMFWCLTK